jgi:HlyD family secretion protein
MKQTLRFRLAGKGGVLCAVALLHMLLPPSLAQASPLTVTGRVEIAERVMSIGAANSGIISQILVHEGEHVRATQILAKLDCPTIEADLRAQEAQVRAAQATADRYRNGSRPDEIGVGGGGCPIRVRAR